MAYNFYGKPRVSILTLPSQTSTGPGTSLKLHLGSTGLDGRPHAGPYNRYFRYFTQGLQKKTLDTSQIRQRSIPFASFPIHHYLNFLPFQAKLCERLKA
jgi:hypothetical protein